MSVLDAVRFELKDALARLRETTVHDQALSGLVARIDSAVARASALSTGSARGKAGEPLYRITSVAAPQGPMFTALVDPWLRLRKAMAARHWSLELHRTPALLAFVNALENFQRELLGEAYRADAVEALAMLFAAGQLEAIEATVSEAIERALAD